MIYQKIEYRDVTLENLAPRRQAANRTSLASLRLGARSTPTRLLRLTGDVDISVHVRGAAEVPDEGRPFQSPDVPNLVRADVLVLVEGDVHLVEAAARLEAAHGFLHVLGAVRRQQLVHDVLDQFLLVARKLGNGDARELGHGAANLHGVFRR